MEALREVSLDGYLTVDVASLRALQIFQARCSSSLQSCMHFRVHVPAVSDCTDLICK